jgi:uncharacterized protein (TIGR00297 family)
MAFLTLDFKGTVLTLVLGIAFFIMGLGLGYFFVLVMLLFLVLSAAVTSIGIGYKKKMVLYQATRGIKNVLANGLPPLIMAAAFMASSLRGNQTAALLAFVAFMASVAAITADKFASEIGVFGGTPRMMFTFKKVRKGTSGGISPLGLVSSLFASLIIAVTILAVSPTLSSLNSVQPFNAAAAVASITAAGFIGCIVDSMLGYFEEKGIGNKYTSNFFCGISGALVAIVILILI